MRKHLQLFAVVLATCIGVVLFVRATTVEKQYYIAQAVTKGSRTTIYLTNGTDMTTFPMAEGDGYMRLVNIWVSEGYEVEEWIMRTEVAGTQASTIICVLKR